LDCYLLPCFGGVVGIMNSNSFIVHRWYVWFGSDVWQIQFLSMVSKKVWVVSVAIESFHCCFAKLKGYFVVIQHCEIGHLTYCNILDCCLLPCFGGVETMNSNSFHIDI